MAARPELYVVTYHVSDDKWPEFQEWSNRMKTRMSSHPGHVTSMFHSADEGDDCAVSLVIMFDSKLSMQSWKNDPGRLALIEEADASGLFQFHTRGTVRTNSLFWGLWSPSDSDLDSQPQSKQPPKWKVYFVLLFALYPTLLFMTRIIVPVIKMVPVYPNMTLLLQAAGTMAIMNFLAVPLSFKFAAKMQFLAVRSSWEVLSMISAYLLLMVAEGFFVQGLDVAFSRK